MKPEVLDREVTFVTESLSTLKGATVVEVAALRDDSNGWPEVWPVLILQTPDGTLLQVEVSRDPEGNGPGHLFIGEKP